MKLPQDQDRIEGEGKVAYDGYYRLGEYDVQHLPGGEAAPANIHVPKGMDGATLEDPQNSQDEVGHNQ